MNATYSKALSEAIQLMEMEEDLEPTSALKQAASDNGIPYGEAMAAFVQWALEQL